jgi:hypothetical protein
LQPANLKGVCQKFQKITVKSKRISKSSSFRGLIGFIEIKSCKFGDKLMLPVPIPTAYLVFILTALPSTY